MRLPQSHQSERGGNTMTNIVMTTTQGKITVELFTKELPITTGSFLSLVDEGYFDGLHFHRVIKGFMIQGGCPHSRDAKSGRAGTGGPEPGSSFTAVDGQIMNRSKGGRGGNIPDELTAKFSNEPGTLSMANTGQPNSGGSQFFLNTKHNNFLDWFDSSSPSKHPVFGRVTEGMDIVRKIETIPTDRQDRPKKPQQIISVRRA